MGAWPKDEPRALANFYGDPARDQVAQNLIRVTPPFQMFYDGKPIKGFMFHKKAADALLAALNEIWEYYGHSQKRIDAEGLSKFGGTYNRRLVRGSKTRWSNHAYGAAIDLDVEDNALGTAGDMPQAVIDAFEGQGAKWGGRYKGRKDPMHFEFVENGRPVRVASLGMVSGALPDDSEGDPPQANDGALFDSEGGKFSGLLDTGVKLVKSKTQWAATGAAGTAWLGYLTDVRIWMAIVIAALAAYIIYERSKKP